MENKIIVTLDKELDIEFIVDGKKVDIINFYESVFGLEFFWGKNPFEKLPRASSDDDGDYLISNMRCSDNAHGGVAFPRKGDLLTHYLDVTCENVKELIKEISSLKSLSERRSKEFVVK